jgi:hypothetical protein
VKAKLCIPFMLRVLRAKSIFQEIYAAQMLNFIYLFCARTFGLNGIYIYETN